MQVAAPIFQRFAGRLRLSRIDVYGRPSDALMARLESKAQLLGGAPVVVNAQRGGFVHLGHPAPIASPARFPAISGCASALLTPPREA